MAQREEASLPKEIRFSLGAHVLVQLGTSTGARNVQPQVA